MSHAMRDDRSVEQGGGPFYGVAILFLSVAMPDRQAVKKPSALDLIEPLKERLEALKGCHLGSAHCAGKRVSLPAQCSPQVTYRTWYQPADDHQAISPWVKFGLNCSASALAHRSPQLASRRGREPQGALCLQKCAPTTRELDDNVIHGLIGLEAQSAGHRHTAWEAKCLQVPATKKMRPNDGGNTRTVCPSRLIGRTS